MREYAVKIRVKADNEAGEEVQVAYRWAKDDAGGAEEAVMVDTWECWVGGPSEAIAVVAEDPQQAAERYAEQHLALEPLDAPATVHVRALPGAPIIEVEVWLAVVELPPPECATALEHRSERADAPIDWQKWQDIAESAHYTAQETPQYRADPRHREECGPFGCVDGCPVYLDALEAVLASDPDEVDLKPAALEAYQPAQERPPRRLAWGWR